MPEPTRTPNPATSSRPQRSSQRVAHKKPLAWLPLALLALLALLAVGLYLILRAVNSDDGTTKAAVPSAGAAALPTAPSVPAAPSVPSAPNVPSAAGAPTSARASVGPGSTGGSAGPTGPQVGAAAPGVGGAGSAGGVVGAGGAPLASTGALIGGAGIAAAPAGSAGRSSGTTVAAPAAGTVGTVLFGEGSASLDSAGRQVLASAAKNLTAGGARNVQVLGYTDVVAGAPVNTALSQQRADAVAEALRSQLPAGVPVTAVGRGEADPAASNDTDSGRQLNRRVAVVGTS